jgi:hypothetical protein
MLRATVLGACVAATAGDTAAGDPAAGTGGVGQQGRGCRLYLAAILNGQPSTT